MKSRYMKPVAMFLVIMMLFTIMPAGMAMADTITMTAEVPASVSLGQNTTAMITLSDSSIKQAEFFISGYLREDNRYSFHNEDKIPTVTASSGMFSVNMPTGKATTTGVYDYTIEARISGRPEIRTTGTIEIVDAIVPPSSGGGGYTYVEPKKTELVYEDKNSQQKNKVYFSLNDEDAELPKDAELVVKTYKPTMQDMDKWFGIDVRNTEYLDINDLDISIIENDVYTHPDGTEYRICEIISINGEEYVIDHWPGTGDILILRRLSDGASCRYNALTNELDFSRSLIKPLGEYPYERINIGGVTYDVGLHFVDSDGSVHTTYLYYKGIPVGKTISGGYYFHEGYDPATLAAQQDDTGYIGIVTIPPSGDKLPTDQLEVGKTYKAYEIGAQDVTVVDKDKNLFSVYTLETAEQKAAREKVESMKDDMDAKRAALDQLDANDPKHMEAWAEWYEAETAYEEAQKELEKFTAAKVTQEFDIPDALVGRIDVEYAAIHDTGSDMEQGIVTVSEDGRTLKAEYYVNSLSPFAVYAFVEHKDRIVMQIDNTTILANERIINNDVPPVIINGRTMVPIRVITETLGGTARWDADTNTAALSIDDKELTMTVGNIIDGFDTAPVILNNRTYVPVRYVAEAIGAKVMWESGTRQIVIEK